VGGRSCSGEFQLGGPPRKPGPRCRRLPGGRRAKEADHSGGGVLGDFEPGNGFLVGRSSAGELAISGYALMRYLNQMPGESTSPIISETSARLMAATTSIRTASWFSSRDGSAHRG